MRVAGALLPSRRMGKAWLCVGLLAAGCGRSDVYQRLPRPELPDAGDAGPPPLCRPA